MNKQRATSNEQQRSCAFRRFFVASCQLLVASYLLLPQIALADAVCCKCTKAGSSDNLCLTIDSGACETSAGPSSSNANLKDVTCALFDTSPAPNAGQCRTIPDGVCTVVTPLAGYAPAAAPAPTPPTTEAPPKLNVPIPELTLSPAVRETSGITRIPWLAQYIAAAQRYLIGISIIAAAIMIVYGGFLYILGSTGAHIQDGKEIIRNAIMGLVLILGAYTILATLNPATIQPQVLTVRTVTTDVTQPMSGASDAVQTLREVGITPGAGAGTTNQKIPADCPGRSSSLQDPKGEQFQNLGVAGKVLKQNYAIECNGRQLDQKTIDFFMKFQDRTGIPASVAMAQIVFEAGKCAIFDMADGKPGSTHFNFHGIGCGERDVPSDACAHVAFTDLATEGNAAGKPHPVGCNVFNGDQGHGDACVNACHTKTQASYNNCGEGCYPQRSHAAANTDGASLWIPSIQCSKKFKTADESLDTYAGFARFCLPYNDSVYKFAYCIGASSYFGTGAYAVALSMVIDRNCLCDPSTDSLGCVRNEELEQKLARNIFRKANLSKDVTSSYQPDYDKIVKDLLDTTHGLLNAKDERRPDDDIHPRP